MYRGRVGARNADDERAEEADLIWRICVAISAARRSGRLVPDAAELILRVAADGTIETASQAPAAAHWTAAGGWTLPLATDPADQDLLELYRPLLELPSATSFVLAHLGQSIDGQIATRTGDSRYVNCPANIAHLHRLRALCDAVIVGRETATVDDPMLTTRLVAGPSPVRVVLDPDLRLPANIQLLTDQRADTLVVCAPEHLEQGRRRFGESRVVGVALTGTQFDLGELRARLAERGLHVLFVEGGGVTVSRFVEQGAADRLHLAVAPVLVGAGRSGLQLTGAPLMCDNLRPAHRLFQMGGDVLWDFDLRGPRRLSDGAPDTGVRVIG